MKFLLHHLMCLEATVCICQGFSIPCPTDNPGLSWSESEILSMILKVYQRPERFIMEIFPSKSLIQ